MGEQPKEKSKRPAATAWKQQRMTIWQPILTAGTVGPSLLTLGIICIPIGLLILFVSENVQEFRIDYTNCTQDVSGGQNNNSQSNDSTVQCEALINKNDSKKVCQCAPIHFQLTKSFKGKVYIYYALTNSHQNHRRYVNSKDNNDLLGNVGTRDEPRKLKGSTLEDPCDPFRYTQDNKFIVPCGAIANSMFSDDISIQDSQRRVIPLLNRGIAWDSDKKYRFKNPSWFDNLSTNPAWTKYSSPTAWRKGLWELDPGNPENNGLQNEDFIVWMRTAALENFRKLYRIVDHENADSDLGIQDGLRKGNYSLHINYSFPVPLGGTKSVIIATTCIFGGKNNFLGVTYTTVGSVCIVVGLIFLIIHMNYGKTIFIRPVSSTSKGGVSNKIQQTYPRDETIHAES